MKSKTAKIKLIVDWADQLTVDQRNSIEEGLEDIRKGRTLSNKKVWAKYGRKV